MQMVRFSPGNKRNTTIPLRLEPGQRVGAASPRYRAAILLDEQVAEDGRLRAHCRGESSQSGWVRNAAVRRERSAFLWNHAGMSSPAKAGDPVTPGDAAEYCITAFAGMTPQSWWSPFSSFHRNML